jgi:hypothetical protein
MLKLTGYLDRKDKFGNLQIIFESEWGIPDHDDPVNNYDRLGDVIDRSKEKLENYRKQYFADREDGTYEYKEPIRPNMKSFKVKPFKTSTYYDVFGDKCEWKDLISTKIEITVKAHRLDFMGDFDQPIKGFNLHLQTCKEKS